MVEGCQPRLDVDAGPELRGRADDDPRQAVVGSLEQSEARLTGLGLVDEADLVGRDAARDELALQVRVHVSEQCDLLGVSVSTITVASSLLVETVSMAFRCTQIQEHELNPSIVFRIAVDGRDLVGRQIELAARMLRRARRDEPHVESGLASVTGDFESSRKQPSRTPPLLKPDVRLVASSGSCASHMRVNA